MGVLKPDYFDNKRTTPAPTVAGPTPAPTTTAPAQSFSPFASAPQSPTPLSVMQPTAPMANPMDIAKVEKKPVEPKEDTGAPVRLFDDVSPEEQAAREQFMIDHPVVARLPKELASTLGLRLPDDETWNRMGMFDRTATILKAGALAAERMVKDLPKEVVRAPLRVTASIIAPWESLARGEEASIKSLADTPRIELPWLGEIPTYFQSYDDAKKSGMGPLAATLFTGGTALGDATITGSLGEASANAIRPRAKLAPGETLQKVEPIKYAIDDSGVYRNQAAGSASEYYTLPKTIAKEQYGGSTNNTFLKVTPAGSDSVELSVVQVRSGAIPKAVDYVKNKLGYPEKNYQGDFGPEVKIESKIVRVPKEETSAIKALPDTPAGEAQKPFIPPKPLKGFENKPITAEQLSTIEKIGNYNGIEPGIRDAVIRTVTGRNVIGELTQAEYTKAAQTLATFNNFSKYSPDAPGVNLFSQYVAPQRHWMRTYEEKSGIPLYSEVYTPMEEAIRLRDVFRDSYRNEFRDIHGKYAGVGFGEERRLISAYMRGEKDAITANTTLTPEVKAELIGIADKMREAYDRMGPVLDVPTDIFLKDYQPRVQNIGGIYQMYKEGSEIPKQLDFFAKFKRKGDLQGIQIDDSLALADIYINSGSNRLFLNPALERIGTLGEKLPANLQGSVKSYVLEKLGYGGRTEQFLDSFVPSINKKLGINLPPDTARQLVNLGMSTMYSGLLSSPATWFRQTFQYPLFGYGRLGPKFAGEAIKTGLSKEGLKEAASKGVLVDLGVPYGEEIAKDITLGGKSLNAYKKATQKIITPNSVADNGMRSIVYHQAKFQWEDALKRYNDGKIAWPQLEKDLDFRAFSKVDQNIIRERLVKGDLDGAFNHFVREIVDETNFPYRKGASSRIGYGLGGKIGSSLLQWPIEAGYTMKRWVTTGQWDKVIRFYAASSAINRTLEETFGFDFSRSFFNRATGGFIPTAALGPAQNPFSPFVKVALDATNAMTAFFNDNREDFNKNKDAVIRTIKSTMPAGVLTQNVQRFWKSYNRGPNENGEYAVLNDKNEVRYYTDFADLFWGQLMGFPTTKKESESFLTTDIRNAQFDRTKTKQRILELFQQEKFDEASDLIAQTGIKITPRDLDDYYIPLNQRTFQSLPAELKAQFAPRVFPQ